MSKKNSWEKRYKSIQSAHPNLLSVDWSNAIDNDDVFIKLIGDVLKSERKVSTPGKRPSLSRGDGIDRLNKILERDYANNQFPSAFRALASGRSVRSLHAKTGLSKSHIQRLLSGEDTPSIQSMEKIAESFNKHPSYFIEYRIFKILESFNYILLENPEIATNWYKKILG